MLAGGAADFGIGSNGFIPLNMLREGANIKAVMAVFQKDPQVLIAHPRRDVKSLADMKGKPIMISDASTVAFWPWLKAKYGYDDTQSANTRSTSRRSWSIRKRSRKAILPRSPTRSRNRADFKPQIFLLADNGYPGYANMVLVPQKWIAGNPAAVQAFVDATREGWHNYLFGNPAPADALIKRDNPDMTDDVIAQAIAKMKSYGIVMSGDALVSGVGIMTDARWKNFFDTMAAEGLYNKNLPYRNAYDLRFVIPHR